MNGESPAQTLPESAWFKSSYSSGAGGECIEVAGRPGAVYVRDSKDSRRPMLSADPQCWAAFVEFAARA